MHAHRYDALVGLAGCDKSLPGMLMAMARLNLPAVFLYGGTILPGQLQGQGRDHSGRLRGRRRDGGGPHDGGRAARAGVRRLPGRRGRAAASSRRTPWPAWPRRSAWRCPGSGSPPAVETARDGTPPSAAGTCMRLLEKTIRPRAHPDRARRSRTPSPSPRPPAAAPTSRLHLPALAPECGLDVTLDDVERVRRRTPTIADLRAGRPVHDAGPAPGSAACRWCSSCCWTPACSTATA